MQNKDRLFDVMLQEETRRLNAHLPKNRRTVASLLDTENPAVSTVDGNQIVMRKSEVEDLARALPDEARERFRLPLVFLRRAELGPGAFILLGDTVEEYAISRIVRGFYGTYDEFKKTHTAPNVFYRPEISELLRRFHSLIVIGFGVSQQENR